MRLPAIILAIITAFWASSAMAGGSAYDHATAGYAAYGRGDYPAAIEAFEAALALDPSLGPIAAQLGYAYKILGQNHAAAGAFRRALASVTIADSDRFIYRREVETLENTLTLGAYLVYREAALSQEFLPLLGPTLSQSQGGVELAWTPPKIGFQNGRRLEFFGRLLWGFDSKSFKIRDESWQNGLGVRWKPLAAHNLVFSGERLIAIGADARNDWMLRASYSWDRGYGLKPAERRWRYTTIYADIAVIDPARPDLFLAAEGRFGESFRVSGGASGPAMILTPHLLLAGAVQHDSFATTTLVEGGPGLSYKLYFADSAMSAHGASVELLAQYRFKLAGTSAGSSGAVLTLVLQY